MWDESECVDGFVDVLKGFVDFQYFAVVPADEAFPYVAESCGFPFDFFDLPAVADGDNALTALLPEAFMRFMMRLSMEPDVWTSKT